MSYERAGTVMLALAVGAVFMIAGWPYAVEASSEAQPISAAEGRRSLYAGQPIALARPPSYPKFGGKVTDG